MEHTLDSWRGVPDGKWRVVSVPHEVADEISGVWPRSTCGLEDEKERG